MAKVTIGSMLLTLMTFPLLGKIATAQQVTVPSTATQATIETVSSSVTDVTASPGSAGATEPSASSATPVAPSGYVPVTAGPLEIIPASASLIISHGQWRRTVFSTTLILKFRNISSSDVKIIAFKNSILGTDNTGETIVRKGFIESSGVILSKQKSESFDRAFSDEKGKFITLMPKQIIEVQIKTIDNLNQNYIQDDDMKIFNTHRPKSASFSGTLGVVTIDGTNELFAFSISEIPLRVVAR